MKKKWQPFCKYVSYGKFSNYWTPTTQSLGLWFYKYWQKWNIGVGHYEKIEKWLPFCRYALYRKILNYWPPPPKLGLWFFECQQKWNISVSHYEKLKNDHHFINMHHTEKFQITNPSKVRSLVYPMSHLWVVFHFLIFRFYVIHSIFKCIMNVLFIYLLIIFIFHLK